ncbi:hypothetical protein QUB30_20935 [Microcoleus sp. BROC3]
MIKKSITEDVICALEQHHKNKSLILSRAKLAIIANKPNQV